MKILFLIFSLLLLTTLTACQQAKKRHQEFSSIEMGMLKSEVLDVAGSPHWSDRHMNMDRWIYYLEPGKKQTERVVYFKNGQVFQKGQRIKPLLSAEEMEDIKKPRSPRTTEFQPSMDEEQLRRVIKKEIQKSKKNRKNPNFEAI